MKFHTIIIFVCFACWLSLRFKWCLSPISLLKTDRWNTKCLNFSNWHYKTFFWFVNNSKRQAGISHKVCVTIKSKHLWILLISNFILLHLCLERQKIALYEFLLSVKHRQSVIEKSDWAFLIIFWQNLIKHSRSFILHVL